MFSQKQEDMKSYFQELKKLRSVRPIERHLVCGGISFLFLCFEVGMFMWDKKRGEIMMGL